MASAPKTLQFSTLLFLTTVSDLIINVKIVSVA